MKSNAQFIETLESRIAPALLVNGANLLGGTGNPTTGETSTGANTVTLVKVLSGEALVFYKDGQITGISVGQHTKLDIVGDVHGDIVTNLGPDGRLTDSDHNPINGEDGGILNPYGIKGITTHPLGDQKGSIGRIIAGGQIKNVNVAGELAGIYAGNGVFRNSDTAQITTSGIDINSVVAGTQDTYTLHQESSTPNGNAAITNVTVNTARQLEIFAGSGVSDGQGAGAYGSGISNVTITKTLAAEGAKPVVFLHAGDGGAGTDGGGAGGAITSFNDQGSIAYVKLQTGDGGDAANGTGGVGGSLSASTIVSSSTRYDFVMGHGGNGLTGGMGGGIKTLTFTNNILGGSSLVATADVNNDGLPDVIFVNSLTGEPIVSLGTTGAANPGEAHFRVEPQTILQADGTTLNTPFLPAEGANPTSLVVADFNGDGFADFAVSYASTNSLGVYLNTQHEGFIASAVNLGTLSPTRLAAGDFSGSGHADLAVVSAAATTTAQAGLASEVFVAVNDGTGHFALQGAPAAVLPGTATDAAAVPVYDAAGTVVGAHLYVGLKTGGIDPVFFNGGTATPEGTINAFITDNANHTVNAPVASVSAVVNGGTELLLAYTKDFHAQTGTTDPTATVTPQVKVFAVDANGLSSLSYTFTPDASTTKAAFVAGTGVIGTVAPGGLTLWSVLERNYAPLSSIGSDGELSDFAATQTDGIYQIAASGSANNRFFFTSGNPAATNGIAPFLPSETPFEPRQITFGTGNGGNGDTLAGGAGGSIKALTYTQTLDGAVQLAGGSYNTVLTTGQGGSSNAGAGGNGGQIHKATLSLSPSYLTYSDDTTTADFLTGAGGQGATGGNGGAITKTSTNSVFSEVGVSGNIILNSVAVKMVTGDGGVGTSAKGGTGGNITLDGQAAFSGVTFVDRESAAAGTPGLLVTAGNGGAGFTQGGDGGSLTNVGSQNAAFGAASLSVNELSSALLVSGNGGSAAAGYGGAGGNITGTNVTTQEAELRVVISSSVETDSFKDGSVTVVSGDGGVGRGGGGGQGGLIEHSTIASVNADPSRGYGVLVKGGVGGDGDTGGGAGGSLKRLNINGPADPDLYDAVVVAGHGGNALGNGKGGRGGSVQNLTQIKDVNSAINVIQGGDGGTGAGDLGGAGGTVKNINAVGFLGLPSTNAANLGAFHDLTPASPIVASLFSSPDVPQGIYAGVGADGAVDGSILNVVARQIAAMGATVQSNDHFAVANIVDNITADLIGYQVHRAQSGFESADGSSTSPSQAVPLDGFILASTVTNVNTKDNGRTGVFTFNG